MENKNNNKFIERRDVCREEHLREDKRCKHCNGVLSYEKRVNVFCTRSCAAKYNNKKRDKEVIRRGKESLKRFHQQNPKERKTITYNCMCCAEVTKTKPGRMNGLYCVECRKERYNIILYKKLGLDVNRKLQEVKVEALSYLHTEYYTNKKSMLQIQRELKVNTNTLHRFFKKNKIERRTLSEGSIVAIEEGRATPTKHCFSCFKSGYHTTWEGKVFFLRSSYEFILANKLDELKEVYEVENLRFRYKVDNKERMYIPDFYLPKRNLVIEVKSERYKETDPILLSKKGSVLNKGYNFKLMYKKDIETFTTD